MNRRAPLSRHAELRSKTPLSRSAGLRPVSNRRAARDASYSEAREQVRVRSGGLCEIRSDVCTGRAEHCHHVGGRGGPDPHRLSNLLGACSACHALAHSQVALAYERGWLVKRNGRAA